MLEVRDCVLVQASTARMRAVWAPSALCTCPVLYSQPRRSLCGCSLFGSLQVYNNLDPSHLRRMVALCTTCRCMYASLDGPAILQFWFPVRLVI